MQFNLNFNDIKNERLDYVSRSFIISIHYLLYVANSKHLFHPLNSLLFPLRSDYHAAMPKDQVFKTEKSLLRSVSQTDIDIISFGHYILSANITQFNEIITPSPVI